MHGLYDMIPLLFVLLIPMVAIIGGITAGIIKTMNRQRLVELAQKERIAAIERGMDPSKLQPLEIPPGLLGPKDNLTFEQKQLRSSQHLSVAGLVLCGFGVALMVMLRSLAREEGVWAVGLLFVMVGVALLVSSRVLRPRNGASAG